jgi:hypothetical protein
MSNLPEIEQRIREDWPGSAEPAPLAILRALTQLKSDASAYVTLPLVIQLLDQHNGRPASLHAGDREAIASVYKWTEYLASDRIGILDTHFELMRDDGTTTLLEPEVIAKALETGVLFDPDSGTAVEDWKQHVAVYYSVTKVLQEIVGEPS